MKNLIIYSILVSIFFLACTKRHESETFAFIQSQNQSAKDYVINLYQDHDIIILMERDHAEISQYNLFMDIISDPYFIKNVGAVYTEVGVTNLSSEINAFFNTENLDSLDLYDKVTEIYQHADYNHLWFCNSFPWMVQELYKLNNKIKNKVFLYPCDVAFEWSKCQTKEEYDTFDNSYDLEYRDSVMADNFIHQYENMQKKRNGNKKALVIMNTRHAYLTDTHHAEGEPRENFGAYLKKKYNEEVASVCILGLAHPESWQDYSVVKDGYWDYCFEANNIDNVGFTLRDTPLGTEKFDYTPVGWNVDSLLYQDVFTGLVYYKPIEEHLLKKGWKNSIDADFKKEFVRRCELMGFSKEEIKQEIDFFNKVSTSRYHSLQSNREKINKWKNKKRNANNVYTK